MKDRFLDNDKLKILKDNGSYNRNKLKITVEKFKTNSFFDPYDLVQVKYEMLRSVEKEGISVTTASKLYGFSRVAFYKIQKAFKELGFEGLFQQKRGPHGSYKLSEEAIDFIHKKKSKLPEISNKELSVEVHNKFGIKVHPRTIGRIIKKGKKKYY